MPATHFTVSQIRAAAACPRILYFDAADARARGLKQPAVTRVWKTAQDGEGAACGTLFHAAIERFNGHAAGDSAVRHLLDTVPDRTALFDGLLAHVYRQHVNTEALFQKPAAQQQAFMEALRRYVGELADILVHARACGQPTAAVLDEMFGDRRRRVDVTFPVGPA